MKNKKGTASIDVAIRLILAVATLISTIATLIVALKK